MYHKILNTYSYWNMSLIQPSSIHKASENLLLLKHFEHDITLRVPNDMAIIRSLKLLFEKTAVQS
jgi:hypothetical protein